VDLVQAESCAVILITGANGHLGKKLIAALAGTPVRALVRSDSARLDLQRFVDLQNLNPVEIVQVDYLDSAAMAAAADSCTYLVHLVGIIKESHGNSFHAVHEETTRLLLTALQQSSVRTICYLSLLGADGSSCNPCLASRGRAEQLLMAASIPALVLQIPMVLGAGDYASKALYKKATSRIVFTLRGNSLEQPIAADDVVKAICTDITRRQSGARDGGRILRLAGPESLSRTALIRRAAALLNRRVTIISLPLGIGLGLAWLLEKLSPSPPVSRAMLGVLDHDDQLDPRPACEELAIELTSLDRILEKTLQELS
jgi:uncharacterized protein YbjT (DUF2867 family)